MLLISLYRTLIFMALFTPISYLLHTYDVGGIPAFTSIFFGVWIYNMVSELGESLIIDWFNPEEKNASQSRRIRSRS